MQSWQDFHSNDKTARAIQLDTSSLLAAECACQSADRVVIRVVELE
jgi:hypothetical protein